MAKNKRNQNTNTTKAGSGILGTVGHIAFTLGKVLLIVLLVGTVLSATLLPISLAQVKKASKNEMMTISSINVETNTVELSNSKETVEVYLLGVLLNPEADFSKYIGAEVYTRDDAAYGRTDSGLQQSYIMVENTGHVFQMDMIIDGAAYVDPDFRATAAWYDEYRECESFGVYPEG